MSVVANRTKRTDRARETFIETLAKTCNVSASCRAAGIGRTAAYDWRAQDAAFAAEWDDAEKQAADALRQEAWRRGVEGVDKPVTFQGRITDTYKDYSDRMLEILLKGHCPEYRDKTQVDHGVTAEAAALIEKAMSPKQAAEKFRDELG